MDGEESKPNCLKINCTRFRIKQHTVKVVYMFFKKRKIWESIHNKWFENSILDFHTLWQWLSNKSLICYIWTRCVLNPWWPCSYKGRWCHLSKSSLAKDSSVIAFFLCVKEELYHGMLWDEKNQKQTLKIEANASTAPRTRKWFKTSSVTEDRTSCVHSVKLKELQKETHKLMEKSKILY